MKREKKLLEFFTKNFWIITLIVLVLLIVINVQIRMLPLAEGPSGKPGLWNYAEDKYTLGPDLDPWFFYRYAKYIHEDGKLPEIDTMRYSPNGYDPMRETWLLPYSIVMTHDFLELWIGDVSIEYAAIMLPVFMSIFMILSYFLLVREIFKTKGKILASVIALIACAFLLTLPSLLGRTIAGIPEKESMGFALLFFALYFFLLAWKKKSIFIALVAGAFTAALGLVWGGVIFVYAVCGGVVFVMLLSNNVTKREFLIYSIWLFSSMALWIPFTLRMSLDSFLKSSTSGFVLFVWFMFFMHLGLNKLRMRDKGIPEFVQTVILSFALVWIVSSVAFGPMMIWETVFDSAEDLIRPYTSRLSHTVAENKQPYFSDWRGSFGPVVGNFPLFFLLFFVGTIVLFFEMLSHVKVRDRTLLVSAYIIFLVCLIFSRFSSGSILNGANGLSWLMYACGYLALAGSVVYIYLRRVKLKEKFDDLRNLKFEYVFVFILMFLGIIAARSAVRLVMVLAVFAIIPLVYLIYHSVNEALRKRKDEFLTMIIVCISLVIICMAIITLVHQYDYVTKVGKNHIPSAYNVQWQYAMQWVDENTPRYSVFGHWWDYGYWVQSIGGRGTMLDGGNSYGYWNYLMGRHVLTGNNESEAMDVLYSHKVTHFLIDSTELGKYGAYSSIGSNEDYDRLSWVGTYQLDDRLTMEENNETIYTYIGGITTDEDLIITEGEDVLLLPAKQTGIVHVKIVVTNDGFVKEPPIVTAVYRGQLHEFKLRYLYNLGEKVDFGQGIPGCFYLAERVDTPGGQIRVRENAAGFYFSPRNMRANWIKWYFFDEGEHFRLVHSEPTQLHKQLTRDGAKLRSDIFFWGGQFNGPIKIWEIDYPFNQEVNKEYLLDWFPDHLLNRNEA
jgi:asparagine N-glycosylation enzyme membrane subunit Stt3